MPATIAEPQQLMQTLPQGLFRVSSLNNNYAIAELCSTYAGIPQGWLVVFTANRANKLTSSNWTKELPLPSCNLIPNLTFLVMVE